MKKEIFGKTIRCTLNVSREMGGKLREKTEQMIVNKREDREDREEEVNNGVKTVGLKLVENSFK